MNNKGFTLIELLASIILLAVVMSVSTVSVINVIDFSKKKSYDSLIEYAKIGIKDYYIECANSDIIGVKDICNELVYDSVNDKYSTTFGTLLEYGYLKTNSKKDDIKVVKNPTNDKSMNECDITLKVNNTNNNISYEYDIENKDECNRN